MVSFVIKIELINLYLVSCKIDFLLSGEFFQMFLNFCNFDIGSGDVFYVSLVALSKVDDMSSSVLESGIV